MQKIYLFLFLAILLVAGKAFSQTITTNGSLSPFTTCESSSATAQSFTISGTGLTSNLTITGTVSSGFLVSLNGSSFVPSLSLTPSSGIVPTTTIYVSLVGITSPGTVSGSITCTSTGATTQTIPVTGTVNPRPDVNPIANQTLCRNANTTAVNFSGTIPGTVYNWTNSNPAIGLPASGTGNIASFTTTNSTNAPITSTVTVTPQFGSTPPELLYYKFNGAGTTVPNLASNPPAGTANGTINGGLSQVAAGNCGGRLKGAAGNNFTNHINTGWAPNFTSSFTISFIADGFVSNAGLSFLAGFINLSNPGNSLYLGYNAAVFSMDVQGNKFVGTAPVNGGVHTITFVYDAPALVIRAYLDGVLSNTTTLPQPLVISGNAFYVGATAGDAFPTNQSLRSAQSMDEFRMYSRALNLAEIQDLVNSCTPGVACTGNPESFDITVYPDLVVNDPADQTICAGSATTAVNFTGTSGAVYNWTNTNPSIGLAASGTGNIPSFTPTFSGTAPVSATITVTPSFSSGPSCTASSQTFTITVNPIPDVNNVANQTVCNNAATTAINFSGTVPGTNYTWTNSNPSIGLSANGSGNISSFTALNTTGSPITSTITVTPTFGSAVPDILYYKFDGAGTSVPNLASNPPAGTANAIIGGNGSQGSSPICGGAFISSGNLGDQVNTNWQPNHSGSFTISFKNANLSSTVGNGIFNIPSSANVRLEGYITPTNLNIMALRGSTFPNLDIPGGVSTSSVPKTVTIVYNSATLVIDGYVDGVLAASVTALNPINLIYSGNARMEIGRSFSTVLPAGAFLDEFRFYGRVLSLNEIQDLATSCTPGAACTGSPKTFNITVNPSPVVNPVSNQNVCTGNNTTAINFTSNVAGATFSWTNNNTSIGLAASGTGNIPSFVATNTGNTTQTATITVTPTDPSSSCLGVAQTFNISVSPVPTVMAMPLAQTICSESSINNISFTGNVPGVIFDWTRDNFNALTGIPAMGSGNISGILTNNTVNVETTNFTITPSLGGCVGTSITAAVTVKEQLDNAVANVPTQTICSGASIMPIAFTSAYAATTFNWTRNNTSTVTGIAAGGTGNINGALNNTTAQPITVTFTVTPIFNGCTGVVSTVSVVVNPVPNAIATPVAQTICSNAAILPILLSSSVSGTTYNWTRNNTTALTGIPTNGTNNITGTLVNNTNTPQLTTFTITPFSAAGCTVISTTATVLVYPNAIVNPVVNQTVCNNKLTTPVNFTSPTSGGVVQYNWTNSDPSIGLAASGLGNIPAFTAVNNTNNLVTATITVIPTFIDGLASCIGTPYSFTIAVRPAPPVTLNSFLPVCKNAASFAITGGSPTASVGTTGIYYVDGIVQANFNPANYTTGLHTILYEYTNAFGCVNSASQTIEVYSLATTNFVINTNTGQCLLDNNFVFNNTTTGATSYLWNFGDGTTATTSNTSKSYTTAGTYIVALTAITNNGCSTTVNKTVTVYPQPATPTVVPVLHNGIQSSITETGYKWFNNNVQLPNFVTKNIKPTKAGYYQVEVSTMFGCTSKSDSLYYIPELNFKAGVDGQYVFLYPIPLADGKLNVHFNIPTVHKASFNVRSMQGQKLLEGIIPENTRQFKIDLNRFRSGTYVVEIIDFYGITRAFVVPKLN